MLKNNVWHFLSQISWCLMIWSQGISRGMWKFRVSQIGGSVLCASWHIVLEHVWIWCLCSDDIFIIRGFILLEEWRISCNASSWPTCCHHRAFDLDYFVGFHLIQSCHLSCQRLLAEYSVFRSVPKIRISFHSLLCNMVSVTEVSFWLVLWICR